MEHLMANGLEQMGFANAGFPYRKSGLNRARSDWATDSPAWYAKRLSSYTTNESNVYKSFKHALAAGVRCFLTGAAGESAACGVLAREEAFCGWPSAAGMEATSSVQMNFIWRSVPRASMAACFSSGV